MYGQCLHSAKLLFAAADATWRCEAQKSLGPNASDFKSIASLKVRGDSGTLLRTAFDARERAYAILHQAIDASSIKEKQRY
ncbi:hypothetical protein [Methylorubrum suomiense]|uniref:Uncharacterized protein n=1 Tax=Methylorubrum suomiense TaxID=144191 RepID=A0ABQ4V0I3_9HYPH|nr:MULTISPECIES: hypothetical protein [Methylobacteriaceae]GJE77579.1 hypothetical protein BGCPKDLD_4185 [Methylorubrum suomiense]